MINDLLIRWLATGLFVFSGADYALSALSALPALPALPALSTFSALPASSAFSGAPTVTQQRAWTSVVSNGLHLVMAIAMVVMLWPVGAALPTTGPAVFFLLAAGWFATLTALRAKTITALVGCSYHALMMLAMAWMYVAMSDQLLACPAAHQTMAPGTSMPGMHMSGTDMAAGATAPGWVSAVNWFWLLAFAIAAIIWVIISVRARPRAGTESWRSCLTHAGRAMMAAGMAIAFAAMVFGI